MARVLHNLVGLIGLLAITVPSSGIRVYWNTNTGPIVPPTSTPAPVPQPPFRDPAPVWEDQRDDVPNPNPYVYILPPPSRPKYNDITAQRKQNQQEYSTAAPSQPAAPTTATPVTPSVSQTPTQAANTGRIIERPVQVPSANNNNNGGQHHYQNQNHLSQNQQQQQPRQIVPSLAVQYVPNQGLKYYAVVPVGQNGLGGAPASLGKAAYLKTNDAQLNKEYERYPEKPNGRYNAKLKKYKAFEKVKYVPYYVVIALVACLAVAVLAYEDFHSHPSYKYEYGVKDSHTHDHKSQWESRDGDHVKGQYTLDEADGTHRVVDYSSDHKTGFQPHVQRVGHAHHPHGESYSNIKQHY